MQNCRFLKIKLMKTLEYYVDSISALLKEAQEEWDKPFPPNSIYLRSDVLKRIEMDFYHLVYDYDPHLPLLAYMKHFPSKEYSIYPGNKSEDTYKQLCDLMSYFQRYLRDQE